MRFLALVVFTIAASEAAAYCREPNASMRTPTKPDLPWCVNEWANTHTCDDWVIDGYYDELEAYNDDAERFIRALNQYADDAVSYAQCRAEELE
jgi:hypothetical protein